MDQHASEGIRPARVFVPAFCSSVLLWASFFPLSLGFLAWFALVPWLWLVRVETTTRRRYLAAGLSALLFFTAALYWVPFAHPLMSFAWVGIALYCSLLYPLALHLIRKCDRAGWPLWLSVPTVFVGLEYLRAHFPTGFPWLEPLGLQHLVGFGWYYLGHTQHDYLAVIQIADFAGVYGITFLIGACNGALAELVPPIRQGTKLTARTLAGPAVVAVLVSGAIAYGWIRLDHPPFEEGPRVALIQGNLPQEVKNLRGMTVLEHFKKLCDQADAPPPGEERADLIVWPETACPDDWYDPVSGLSLDKIPARYRKYRFELAQYVRETWHSHILFGLNTITCDANGEVDKYNSAVLIRPDGIPVARYDKMHLVPFGEYVPLRNIFPWLQSFTPYSGDYSCTPGDMWTRFPIGAHGRVYRFAVLICYEDTDPSLSRRNALPDGETPPVDFLINISNDGWFRGTAEHEQHLAICRFRAIEARRSVIRAVNMGISGIIDSDGRVVKLPADTWAQSKRIEAVVRGTVPIDNRKSWYARLGDWLPLMCWGLLPVAIVVSRLRRAVHSP